MQETEPIGDNAAPTPWAFPAIDIAAKKNAREKKETNITQLFLCSQISFNLEQACSTYFWKQCFLGSV